MFNQGNVFVGHSLALVTTITLKDGRHVGDDIGDAIREAVRRHLEKRFNKRRYAQGGDDILGLIPGDTLQKIKSNSSAITAIIEKRVRVTQIADDVSCETLESIIPASDTGQEESYGTVYILFRSQTYQERPDYSNPAAREEADIQDASFVSLLQSIVPNIHVEFFAVTYDTDDTGQEDCLYHLASRVCGTLVEYKACLHLHESEHDGGTDRDVKAVDSVHLLKALPLMNDHGCISQTVKASEVVRKIFDLRDAVDLVCEGLDGSTNFFPPVPRGMQTIFKGEDNKTKKVAARYKFPFGVWFRGQPRVCLDLMPSLYHEKSWHPVHEDCRKMKCDRTMYDESTLVHHFMAHRATLRRDYSDAFEWLCLMQHYGAPSRVLDWTENILTALYFAVADTTADCDAAVWVLNAGRLNEITRVSTSKRYVCLADSADVILRSAMALSRTGRSLRRALLKAGKLEQVEAAVRDDVFWRWTKEDESATQSKTLAKLACPVAVFPTRLNERESMQLATFTIYGGKDYDREVEQIAPWERFPDPKGLLWISQHLQPEKNGDICDDETKEWTPRGKPFLDVFVVPSCAKRKLREQLKRVGVHVGSLFPELEYQGKYIRHQWRFEYRPE